MDKKNYHRKLNFEGEAEIQLEQAKRIIKEILRNCSAGVNGGYYTEFSPLLCSRMISLTNFDMEDRTIINGRVVQQITRISLYGPVKVGVGHITDGRFINEAGNEYKVSVVDSLGFFSRMVESYAISNDSKAGDKIRVTIEPLLEDEDG